MLWETSESVERISGLFRERLDACNAVPWGRLKDKALAASDKVARVAVRAAAKAKKEAPPQKNTLFKYVVARKVRCNCTSDHLFVVDSMLGSLQANA